MSRPELTGHASLFYNAKEARKYDSSSRMVGIQREITERAIELLKLPTSSAGGRDVRPSLILDVGCGSGLSGQVRAISHWRRDQEKERDCLRDACYIFLASEFHPTTLLERRYATIYILLGSFLAVGCI